MAKVTKKKKTKRTNRRTVRVLFTCVGRRVELIRSFRRAGEALGIDLEVHGADTSRLAPAMHHVDKAHLVPPISGRRYISSLLELVRRKSIDLLIPLIDHELIPLAGAAQQFEELGCIPLISAKPVVQACRDKLLTYEILSAADIDTPATWAWNELVNQARHRFPYYLKPRFGSAAQGNFVINNKDELHTFGLRVPDPIVQELVEGVEYTLDVYTGFTGEPQCVVPRRRLEVRIGEVSKALVVKNRSVMAVGKKVAQTLHLTRGVITVQCIVTADKRVRVIEINPRFGGGVPLSIEAGADFPKWLLQELLGDTPRIQPYGFRNDVAMLRFDDSVFLEAASRTNRARPR